MSKQYHIGDEIRLPNSIDDDAYAICEGVYQDCYYWRLSFDNCGYFIRKDLNQYQELMQNIAYDPHYQGFTPC